MKNLLKTLAVYCTLLSGAFSLTIGVAAGQENLIMGFKVDEWVLANESASKTQIIHEFVPPGQKIKDWTELLTSQTLKKPRTPPAIDALAASSYDTLVKKCPGKVTWNVIAREAPAASGGESMLFEWSVKDCPPETDRHEVARILYGKFNIFRVAYVAKTSSLAPEKRDKWIAELTATRIWSQ